MILRLYKKIKNYISKKFIGYFNVNYIFFSFFTLLIAFFCAFKTNILFTIYSLLQTSLITICFIFLHYFSKSKFLKRFFTSIAFLIMLFYTANFILIGLMDTNLLFAINVFFSGGLENLLIAFRALNINFTSWLILFFAIFLIPFIGLAFYKITSKLCQKKPFFIKQRHLLYFFVFSLILMLSIDATCRVKNIKYISKNNHKLPLFTNFLPNPTQKISLSNNLKSLKREKDLLDALNKKNVFLEKKPNIFIFVVEALRHDFVTKDITSNIYEFEKESYSSNLSYSAANATQISWYSIFHSNSPLFWSKANKINNEGSIPLHILKRLGYKINVFSSAEMTYFHMDKLLFGKDKYLVDNFNDFSSLNLNPSQKDGLAIDSLNKAIQNKNNKEGNVFLVFLDSTHSEYSFPKDFNAKFTPYAKGINYLSLSHSKKNLPLIKNRYKNALSYIDHLFNEFLITLKTSNLYDSSIIVLTGDHGEEFFEENSIFHASHLNDYQIKVPIIFKLLQNDKKLTNAISHIDIFPTILKELLPNENFDSFFDGRSIFLKESPYIIAVNQRGSKAPNELLIIKENQKLKGKLTNDKKNIQLQDTQNILKENIQTELNKALKDLIN